MNDNKRIAVNTIVLTVKLIVSIACSFIISRLILQALGVDNYGLYNVVGGIVSLLTVVTTSMGGTTNRYIVVEVGKGAAGNPQKVYSTLFFIHAAMAILLIVIGEPLGAFYINKYLNITSASVSDAQFVFACSLIASFFTVIGVPCGGVLMAHEKFLPISVIYIARSLLNVAMAIFLINYMGNRLRLYAIFMATLNILHTLSIQLYAKYKYPTIARFKFNKNRQDYKEILSFTGWMLIGAFAVVGRTQGVAMVINLFFRNAINAAFGVANQIGQATIMFTSTLRQSVTPQIMKNQNNNTSRSLTLVYAISRYTYLIMLIISVPLLLCMQTILQIWLGEENIPPMTSIFATLLLVNGMLANLSTGFDASIQATGKIRKNQIGYSIINLSIIPIVYLLYKIGLPAYFNVVVGIVLTIATTLFQTYIMKELTDFTYSDYWKKTIQPAIIATTLAFAPMLFIRMLIGEKVLTVLVFAFIATIWSSASAFFVGMNKRERNSIIEFAKNKIHKNNK